MRIIYFDIDCLRPDHLGCYGYNRPTSPTIDEIAEQGTRFENYYCASSPCLPSRTALMSGRFGIRNGVIANHGLGANFHIRLRPYVGPMPDNEMFPRLLRANGYDTFCFSNFADRHNAFYYTCNWTEYHTPSLQGGTETAEDVNEPLMRWLKHSATRDNYYLHINYWDVHRLYTVPPSWADRFKDYPVAKPWPDEKTVEEHQNITGWFTPHILFPYGETPGPLMPASINNIKDFEHMITGYDATIAYTDYHISLVLEELDRQGVLDDAIIILSGDHGDAFGEHAIYSDHVCADECIHRVPLVVRWPGVAPAGGKCDSLLYNVDLAPTICDLLGIEQPADWDGKSFSENLKGNKGLDRDYLVWDHGLYTLQRAVRTKSHLMVHTYDDFGYQQFEPTELYNMQKDPYQTKNIRDEQPEIVEQCNRYLTEWVEEQRSKGHCVPDPLAEILRERNKKPLRELSGEIRK